MHRLLIAAGIVLSVGSAADAAPRHKHKVRPPAPVVQPVIANRPAWAAPQQCFTNEGYGRFVPCDIGDGR